MPNVYNWQLGREMEYPYEAKYPKEQFAFVFNINRCIACQTCTMACKSTWTFSKGQEYMWWNNVETKPYGGYPQHWDVKILQLMEKANAGGQVWNAPANPGAPGKPYGEFKGKTIFEAAGKVVGGGVATSTPVLGYLPTDDEWRAPNFYEDTAVGPKGEFGKFHETGATLPEHRTWFFYLQRICNHCTYPGCLAACPRKAIYKRQEDGVVLVDQERCRGYRKCMEGLVKLDPKTGDWAEDRQNPLYYMVKVAKVALPLYPQFGTLPNGYYIPPRWVPRPYLRQMFGPGVDHAIEAYTVPDRELLAVMQLFRRSKVIVFGYEIKEGPKVFETTIRGKPFTMYNDTVIAYGHDGKEIFRTQVEEPIHIRPDKFVNAL